jgi:hypothetical protein
MMGPMRARGQEAPGAKAAWTALIIPGAAAATGSQGRSR